MSRVARCRLAHGLRCLLGVLYLLVAGTARAEVTRYALYVGNDRGGVGEAPLRYARADARKVSTVLRELGDFRSENTVLLEEAGAEEVQRVLIELNARIRGEADLGRETVLFVYYSGHADAAGLHLGDDVLPLTLLQRLVQGSPATFRILVLDACRSGALTRVKGARAVEPFAVSLAAPLGSEGIAFLTSSTEDEDAQESDALRGSFFTHHFVSGLRGAADTSRDGAVSLEEAYAYAYAHTLRASSSTRHGLQHPSFRLDLKGRGAVPLTWLWRSARGAHLSLPSGHAFLLFAGDPLGPVVAEVGQHDRARTLALEPGSYFVRARGRDYLLEGNVTLDGGRHTSVDPAALDRVEYARLARKGGSERLLAHGPWLGYQARTPLWPEASVCHGARGGYALDFPELTLSLGVGVCRSRFDNDVLRARADEASVGLSLRRVLDLPLVSFAFGGELGVGVQRQAFDTPGRAPARHGWLLFPGVVVGLSVEIGGGFHGFVDGIGRLSIFRERRADASEGTTAVGSLQLIAGVGKRF